MEKINLTIAPYQEQTIVFNSFTLRITVRLNSLGQFFALDVYDVIAQRYFCQGLAIACGVPLCWRGTQPFCFWLNDDSNFGLDPVSVADLARCSLFILHKSEIQQ
ncbi:hypothetical protein A4G19_15890 [Pasteurellaceae bacterium Macca]|nr:hypothetical protein [Pasteurellaceae bacterium Macca]MCK3656156.1 hypothetical protein [Pasteurellaceae bacterium Macca]MCK3656250.1 hypothetical protein [Pasteurellaceae bacterium Macca]MCK3656514.1 hypothetical protein [Pasteurellaceae bacterium Macca]MCK3657137.1 hypothetical protein [Pasteurellaceae bacterium Macca]